MTRRSLSILAVVSVLAVVAALWVVERWRPAVESAEDGALLPGLDSVMNDISAIDIVALDGTPVATLRRERERWRMREKHDYEADFERIHQLLRDLSNARREAARTDNPEWYERLGVQPVGEGDPARAAVLFPGADIPGVIIGETDPAGVGRYVRLEGEVRSWLTGERLEVPVDRLEWLQRAIMDIPADDMQAVTIRHPDGEVVSLRPGDPESGVWVLLDVPPDREVRQAWQLRQRANALAALNLEDVRPHDEKNPTDDVIEAEYLTRDGLRFIARLFEDEAGHWVHFRVEAADEELVSSDPVAEDGTGAGEASRDGEAVQDRTIDAVAIDGRLSPWEYAIEEERFDRLTARKDDLLAPPEEDSED